MALACSKMLTAATRRCRCSTRFITPAPTPDTMIRFAPTNPVGNVLAQLEYQNSRSQSTRVVGNLYAVYEPIDGLKLRSSLGIDRTDGSSRDFVPEFFVSPLQQKPGQPPVGKQFSGSHLAVGEYRDVRLEFWRKPCERTRWSDGTGKPLRVSCGFGARLDRRDRRISVSPIMALTPHAPTMARRANLPS